MCLHRSNRWMILLTQLDTTGPSTKVGGPIVRELGDRVGVAVPVGVGGLLGDVDIAAARVASTAAVAVDGTRNVDGNT